MRTPPLLADFTHIRVCKPFCENSLTLPNFEKAAKDLVSLVYAAEKKEPGKPRTLYLDIDGHRNAQGRFDADMRSSKRDSD